MDINYILQQSTDIANLPLCSLTHKRMLRQHILRLILCGIQDYKRDSTVEDQIKDVLIHRA